MSRLGSLPPLAALSLIAVGLVTVAPASAQSVKLSGSFPDSADVTSFRIVPGQNRVVYRANPVNVKRDDLYAVSLEGEPDPVKLSRFVVDGNLIPHDFKFSADGNHVVYGDNAIFSVASDGSQDPVIIGGAYFGRDYRVGSSIDRVAFRYFSFTPSGWNIDLVSVPVDGSERGTHLNPLADDSLITEYRISPAGDLAVYRTDGLGTRGVVELHSTSLVGSEDSIRLSGPLEEYADVSRFEISPDGRTVVYFADARVDDVHELFSVPIDGRRNAMALGVSLDLEDELEIAASGRRLVYLSTSDASGARELFGLHLDGRHPPRRLSGDLVAGGDVVSFALSPDGRRAVYLADQEVDERIELYSVPLDGSQSPIKLNHTLVDGGDVSLELALGPNSRLMLYLADHDVDEELDLYSVPLDGRRAPVRLNAPLVEGGDVLGSFRISPDGSRALYVADQDVDEVRNLYVVPVQGGRPPVQLNDPLVEGGEVKRPFRFSSNGRQVVYRADLERDDVIELYASRIDRTAAAASQDALEGTPSPDPGDGAPSLDRARGRKPEPR